MWLRKAGEDPHSPPNKPHNIIGPPGRAPGMSARLAWRWLALLPVLGFGVPVEKEREAMRRLHPVFGLGESWGQRAGPRRRPPQYMLDLFNAVADANGRTKTPGLLRGNTVRSFQDKVHGEQTYFYFNVTSVGRDEQLLKAELRLFKLREHSQPAPYLWKVDLCELLDGSGVRVSLISSKTISLYTEGWEVFTVTQTVWKWVRNSSSNHGFMIVTSIPSGNSLELGPVRFAKSRDHQNDSQPFLVIFTDDRRRGALENPMARVLPEDNPWPKEKEPTVSALPDENAILSSARLAKSRRTRALPVLRAGRLLPCQKHPLYVDFEQIGWSTWIISPRGYSAYYCTGTCPFPLGQGFRATNHAAVQSIVNTLRLSKEVGTPCCVPDTLHSINLLYFDDEENVVLKQYDDMVAVSCGCH